MKYFFLLSLLFITPAHAADMQQEKGTAVSLSATSTIELPNDEAVVLYRIEAKGAKADALRQEVNRISGAVHARLKKEDGLKQTTLSRRMEMVWRYESSSVSGAGKQVRDGWKLVQQEQVTSSKIDAVADWVDAIEKEGAHLDSLSFRISEAAMKPALERLQLQAVQAFRIKAANIAKSLDAPSFRIAKLQTGNQMPAYQRAQPEMMLMRASVDSAPSLNAGEGKISVTISGEIILPEMDFPAK